MGGTLQGVQDTTENPNQQQRRGLIKLVTSSLVTGGAGQTSTQSKQGSQSQQRIIVNSAIAGNAVQGHLQEQNPSQMLI